MSDLLDRVRGLVRAASEAFADTEASARLSEIELVIDEPLRVAIAGRVKAGKSTLLNALLGDELAPTDAGECTRIVTWYREGVTYRVMAELTDNTSRQLRFTRDDGPIDVELGQLDGEQIAHLEVEWPTKALHHMTVIDTPGIGSLSETVSDRTLRFLTPDDQRATPADAVLYLMRHVHHDDITFLEAFHDDDMAQATPINAIGVLSRADEVGVARLDAMDLADRIAGRYRRDRAVRRLCQTVVPVAGLLAQAGAGLRESEYRAFALIAEMPEHERDDLLMSVDRFRVDDPAAPLTPEERAYLLERYGLFGVRLAVELLAEGEVTTATELSTALIDESGMDVLRHVLTSQFSARRETLKARSALLALEEVLAGHPGEAADAIGTQIERVRAGAHEFAETHLLNALRTQTVDLPEEQASVVERLLGIEGQSPAERLGRPATASDEELSVTARTFLHRYQRLAENPLATREQVEAARILVRTCEGLLVTIDGPSRP